MENYLEATVRLKMPVFGLRCQNGCFEVQNAHLGAYKRFSRSVTILQQEFLFCDQKAILRLGTAIFGLGIAKGQCDAQASE